MTHDDLAMVEYGSQPAVLILADGEGAEARARRSAEAAGCRVADVAPIGDAIARLERQVHADAVLLEIDSDHGKALDGLLDRLEWSARSGHGRSVVAAPASLIDVVSARVWHEGIAHLSDPDERQRADAIADACAPRETRLHDLKDQPGRLQQLSQEVGRIADILANLSANDVEPAG